MTGKKHSAETRAKISKAMMGKKYSQPRAWNRTVVIKNKWPLIATLSVVVYVPNGFKMRTGKWSTDNITITQHDHFKNCLKGDTCINLRWLHHVYISSACTNLSDNLFINLPIDGPLVANSTKAWLRWSILSCFRWASSSPNSACAA